MSVTFAFKLYRIQLRMMFGPKHRYRKEYDHALDTLGERGHWFYLYDALEGPKADQVCVALKKWIEARQDEEAQNEKELKRELHVLIYGEFTEGRHGFVE